MKKKIIKITPYIAVLILSVAYFLLNWNRYFTLYDWADVDDTMQYDLSRSLAEGEWLGPYTRATLIKGIVFPLWTAGLHNLQIPIWFATGLLTIIAGLFLIYALRRLIKNKWLLATIYALVLFNPVVTDRVYRDYLIHPLTLLMCAWAIGLFVTILHIKENRKVTIRDSIIFGVLGIVLLPTWYYLREDGYWIMPLVLGLLSVAIVVYLVSIRWKILKHLKQLLLIVVVIAVPFATVSVVGSVIAQTNEKYYGRAVVNDYFSDDFKDAYASLTRVNNRGDEHLTVPVSEEMREELYRASPAFKELRFCLDAENGKGVCEGFKLNGVDATNINDYQGGWLPFAIRLAADIRGYYETPSKAAAYYERLTSEVNAACEAGTLSCHAVHSVSLLPTPNTDIMSALFTSKTSSVWSMIAYLQKLDRDDSTFNTYKVPIIPESQYLNDMAVYYGVRYIKPTVYGAAGEFRVNAENFVLALYKTINPILMYGAILITLLATFIRVRRKLLIDWKLLVIAWLVMLTIGFRLAMLAYVYTVHFPTTANIYFAPVYSLLFLFEGLGIAMAVIMIKNFRGSSKTKTKRKVKL